MLGYQRVTGTITRIQPTYKMALSSGTIQQQRKNRWTPFMERGRSPWTSFGTGPTETRFPTGQDLQSILQNGMVKTQDSRLKT